MHDKFSNQLTLILSQLGFIELIGHTRSYSETASILQFTEPDLVLMDLGAMPFQLNSAVPSIKIKHPGMKVFALTMFQDEVNTDDLFRYGFDNSISRVCEMNEIRERMNLAFPGHSPLRQNGKFH